MKPLLNGECQEPECAGMGKCLRQEHVDKRSILALDPDAVRSWLKQQENASNFGGACEYDHDTADKLIEAMLDELESTTAVLMMVFPDATERLFVTRSPAALKKYLQLKAEQ